MGNLLGNTLSSHAYVIGFKSRRFFVNLGVILDMYKNVAFMSGKSGFLEFSLELS